MSDAKHIVVNSLWVTIGRIVALILTLVSTLLIARILTPHDYGVLNLGLTIMFLGTIFADFGTGPALVYFIPRTNDVVNLIKKLTTYRIITTLLTSAVIFLLAKLISEFYRVPEMIWVSKFFSISLIFYATFFFIQQALQGFKAFKLFMLTDIISALTRYLPILAVSMGFGVYGASAGFCLAYLLSTIISLFVVPFVSNYNKLKIGDVIKTGEIVRYALFNFVAFAFYMAYNFATNLIIAYYLPANDVGFFTLAWQLGYYAVLTIPIALGTTLLPNLSEMASKSQNLHEVFRKVTKYMIYFAIPASLGLIMLSNRFISLVFGAKYIPAAEILSLMCLGFLVQGCATSIESLALGIGKPKLVMLRNGLQASMNIVLCIILVPRLGLVGAGISFIVINIVGTMLLNYWAIKEHRFWYPFKSLLRATFAAIVMSFFIKYGSMLRIIPLVLLAILIYFATLFLIGGFDKDDARVFGLDKWILQINSTKNKH